MTVFLPLLPDLGGDGACKAHPNPDIFFTDNPADRAEAEALCGMCPVKLACQAVGATEHHGLWGGIRTTNTAGRGRQEIEHGSGSGAKAHRRRDEDPCNACLDTERANNRAQHAARQAAKEAS